MPELSLLAEARIETRKRKLLGKTSQINKNLSGSKILEVLLPNYDQQIKPRAFHNAKQLHRGLKGGVASGKTYTLGADDILMSYLNRPHFHLSTSPSLDNAITTVVPVLERLCKDNDLEYDWILSKNLFKIIWGNSARDAANILIFGADKPKFLKGISAASGSMNEPFTQKKEAFEIWWERIRPYSSSRLSRTWAGTAEPEKMQWGWEYFEKLRCDTPELYLDTISTYENKFLNGEYIQGLESIYDAKQKEVYMFGKCLSLTKGKAYYGFDREKNVICEESRRSRDDAAIPRQIIISFDFNVDPMCAVEIIIDDVVRIQVDEYKISSSNTGELTDLILNRIRRRYDLDSASFIITGDAAGRQGDTRSQLRTQNDYTIIKSKFEQYREIKFTIYVPQQNPFVHDRVNYVNNLFEKELFSIQSGCIETIKDFELVTWKQGAEKFHLDKSKKEFTHLSDAAGYALWNTRALVEKRDGEFISAGMRERWG